MKLNKWFYIICTIKYLRRVPQLYKYHTSTTVFLTANPYCYVSDSKKSDSEGKYFLSWKDSRGALQEARYQSGQHWATNISSENFAKSNFYNDLGYISQWRDFSYFDPWENLISIRNNAIFTESYLPNRRIF